MPYLSDDVLYFSANESATSVTDNSFSSLGDATLRFKKNFSVNRKNLLNIWLSPIFFLLCILFPVLCLFVIIMPERVGVAYIFKKYWRIPLRITQLPSSFFKRWLSKVLSNCPLNVDYFTDFESVLESLGSEYSHHVIIGHNTILLTT